MVLQVEILVQKKYNSSSSGIYSYFHDLLGGEELEKLDKEYFGRKKA
jgi:hypothetical protein